MGVASERVSLWFLNSSWELNFSRYPFLITTFPSTKTVHVSACPPIPVTFPYSYKLTITFLPCYPKRQCSLVLSLARHALGMVYLSLQYHVLSYENNFQFSLLQWNFFPPESSGVSAALGKCWFKLKHGPGISVTCNKDFHGPLRETSYHFLLRSWNSSV